MPNYSRTRVLETILVNIEQFLDDAENDKAAARTYLGLGTIATQDANNVAITGGTISGVTIDLGDEVITSAPTNGETIQSEDVLATTDATPTALFSFVLEDDSVVLLEANVLAFDGTEAYSVRILAQAERLTGAASIVLDNRVIKDKIDQDLSVDANVVVDTGTGAIEIEVTGIAATNITWRAHTVLVNLTVAA